ncbi:UDP-N-acetylmuramoyl-L-alanyl-D-glutamate--2,6-diaminopimelate ligase [Nakamurella deserti]|uniref:UDP-N-acetylmuramoyl-L-alanyl-D-glutamate--2, 6-diaminopimelate ligase n=1 Tax=Nakamurella deserti TaxID=2164074 RepID=UPI000DBE78CA|nr:UDP-N-acetylmuramoyl-L-alanyl-D-glutamate--2,6-diaminopimelate ligase [Nakamurella deserti]
MSSSPSPRPARSVPQSLVRLADLAGARLEFLRPATDEAGHELPDGADVTVTGITLRSGDVQPGDLFAALPGGRSHGASAVAAAVGAGAVAMLTDPAGAALAREAAPELTLPLLVVDEPRPVLGELAAELYGRPSESLLVIGITGTSGKTTTSYLVEAGLVANGLRTGVIGTVETRIGADVLPSAFTTPEAPDLQALLAVMVERGVQAVAMEVSSHALALHRVGAVRFAVGAFTNLSQDHLDFHADIDDYFRTKAQLFDGRAAAGVVDVDGEYGRRLAAEHPEVATVAAFSGAAADWTVTDLTIGAAGITNFTVHAPAADIPVALELPGSFNVSNAVLALACIAAAGLDPLLAAPTLTSVVVPGRMQSVDHGQPFLAVVDYAHKPAALTAVLTALRPDTTGRIVLVIGAGGDRDRGKRALMGAAAVTGADIVVVTDDNPRTEDPAAIRAEILAGIAGVAHTATVHEIGDRRAAIRAAVDAAGPGDTVVIAGKGHEQGQYVGDTVIPFSDVDELTDALHARAAAPTADPAAAPAAASTADPAAAPTADPAGAPTADLAAAPTAAPTADRAAARSADPAAALPEGTTP